MEQPTEVEHILCPVFSHQLKLITLINLPQTVLDGLEQMSSLIVEVAADPRGLQVENPDPKDRQVELTVTMISIDGNTSATFFAEDAEKALRLPCAFAPGQALAVAETYNTGFNAGANNKMNLNRAARRAK